MRRLGWKTELDMIVDIIGSSVVSGRTIKNKLIERGMDFKTPYLTPIGSYILDPEFDQFIDNFLDNNILIANPGHDVMSGYKVDNDYCLSKYYLRKYKLKELGI